MIGAPTTIDKRLADSGVPWIGRVPSHWTITRFGRDVRVNEGQVDPRVEPWASMILLAPNHVESGTSKILGLESAKGQGADSGKYLVRTGQVVYAKIRPALNKVTIAPQDCLCSADMYAMSGNPNIVDHRFLVYWMLARPFVTFASLTSYRVKMPKINRDELSGAPWARPPLEEQRQIADFLDRETTQIDGLIAKQEQLIVGLSERRLAVIDRAITKGLDPTALMIASGEKSLGDVPAHWKLCRIKDVGRAIIGLTYAPEDVVTDEESSTLVLRACNIQDGSISLADSVYVKKRIPSHLRLLEGDIVVCARNGSAKLVGKNATATSEVAGQTWGAFMAVLRSSQHAYLRWILSSQLFTSQTGLYTTATINQLTSSTLHNLRIALPPARERESISKYLDEQTAKIDALIAKAKEFIALARERRAALITEAVTGRVDVSTGKALEGA